MPNETNIQGNHNIVIQGVQESTITVNVNGQLQEVERKLDVLLASLQKWQATSIQTSGRIYPVGNITPANFDFILGQSLFGHTLPPELAQNLVPEDKRWIQSIRQELLKLGVSVGNDDPSVFQHFGWLIGAFLQKMGTHVGKERSLRRLSFMAEAFQSSLRYLCFIQMSQLLKGTFESSNAAVSAFLRMKEDEYRTFDYLNLLLLSTELLEKKALFIEEMKYFIQELSDPQTDLYATAIFLDKIRNDLITGMVIEGESFHSLLEEYLTGLVYWLRKIAFLAKYRLISIKEISLKYRLGTSKNFVHTYGELHGFFHDNHVDGKIYNLRSIENAFTYNHSVILIKGKNVEAALENLGSLDSYLSLSPLVIDQSVLVEEITQTPNIYYFIGLGEAGRNYRFAQYTNELPFNNQVIPSNKELTIKTQNNQQPKLDELFEEMEKLFNPLKNLKL